MYSTAIGHFLTAVHSAWCLLIGVRKVDGADLWCFHFSVIISMNCMIYMCVCVCVCLCSISGTVAVIVTCPLEVVKTRFQSSIYASLIRTVSYMPQCAYSASAVPGASYLTYELPSKTSGALHNFLHKSPSGGFSRICWFIG